MGELAGLGVPSYGCRFHLRTGDPHRTAADAAHGRPTVIGPNHGYAGAFVVSEGSHVLHMDYFYRLVSL